MRSSAARRPGLEKSTIDGLGSVTALTDAVEAVVATYRYDAFGEIYAQTGSVSNTYLFTGREIDAESGLYYYRARYYELEVGRFVTQDPIGLKGGINFYVYVQNNPVNFVDPYGLFSRQKFTDCLKEALVDVGSHAVRRVAFAAAGCAIVCGAASIFTAEITFVPCFILCMEGMVKGVLYNWTRQELGILAIKAINCARKAMECKEDY